MITTKEQRTPVEGFNLWFRTDGRDEWRVVATTRTHAEAVGCIGLGGRRNGDWLILPNGQQPGRTR